MGVPNLQPRGSSKQPWWSNAIVYRVDLRSFSDSDGDGIGDLDGVRDRLGHVEILGADTIWLTGVLASPIGKGKGYDVDPIVGTLESLEALVSEAHEGGVRVVVDTPVSSRAMGDREGRDELAATLHYWMGLAIDGIRFSAAPGLTGPLGEAGHDVLRLVRPIMERYQEHRRMVGAVIDGWSTGAGNLHELDVGVDERFCSVAFDATAIREAVSEVLAGAGSTGSTPAWGLSDWEHPRPVTRYGDGEVGLARARAMILVQCALPGVVGVDNGNELGLPMTVRHGDTYAAPTRSIMPWEGSQPPFGFSDAHFAWWPTDPSWATYTVAAEMEDCSSTLSLYRRALELRRAYGAGHGFEVDWYGAPEGCLAFCRDGGDFSCALNASNHPVQLPSGDVLLSSQPLDGGLLPPNTAVWLARID